MTLANPILARAADCMAARRLACSLAWDLAPAQEIETKGQ
jgi:hypothetical protein